MLTRRNLWASEIRSITRHEVIAPMTEFYRAVKELGSWSFKKFLGSKMVYESTSNGIKEGKKSLA